jgi:hypothetical protein
VKNNDTAKAVKLPPDAAVRGKPKTKVTSVGPGNPCPVCGGDHKCGVGDDGLILCGREHARVDGYKCLVLQPQKESARLGIIGG